MFCFDLIYWQVGFENYNNEKALKRAKFNVPQ